MNKKKRGPKPKPLQLDEEIWEDTLKKSVLKKKPGGGWAME